METKISPAPIKSKPKLTLRRWILVLVFAAIILFGLHLAGVINIPFFNISNSGSGKINATHTQPAKTCPTTSCDTGECCGAAIGSGMGAIAVSHVLVDKSCDCPKDTILSLDQGPQRGWENLKNCDCNRIR